MDARLFTKKKVSTNLLNEKRERHGIGMAVAMALPSLLSLFGGDEEPQHQQSAPPPEPPPFDPKLNAASDLLLALASGKLK